MLEPVVNFPLYQLEFPFFLLDQRFLVPQFFFDYRNFPVLHVFFNIRKRQIQHPQITDRVEHLKLACAVIAVAGFRVGIFGGEKPFFFIMPQDPKT